MNRQRLPVTQRRFEAASYAMPLSTASGSSSCGGSGKPDGSCMIVIATDSPLEARNLKRLAARAAASAPARNAPVPEEKAGWITTKLKVGDIKDGDVTQVPDHYVLLVRKDKDITALSNRCTHRFAAIPPKAGPP